MAKSNSVTAHFGGGTHVFRFPRVQPGHGTPFADTFSPYGALQRLAAGVWTMDDLLRVLSPRTDAFTPWRADPDIVAVIEAGGPGTYAPLAARVLEAALFGVQPSAEAWDERDPFAVPEA